ncbi:hypothetical protein B0T26DRAFT_294623 [Lasiosphaeria miniovina]|uniref:C2H2-type domain-containing protein n=1 Tax=Lasiosphaeria miniovina TaxID=1954250 RepID=A0AA40AK95_9PEZI|nr:uncharacterized protein B0T26DRAFT_294623 [Lasiosphaeria miniovina]KAK0717340.1 hypothetical protein B0T26DRAFT_294623 [Lasiosphaeria miniovina]
MGPPPVSKRQQTLPPAQTSSAREAQQSFYCEICHKGYSRSNEYEAHLGSYDHNHKQRLKEMKAMVRDPNATARARRQEQKADGVITIKLGDAAAASSAGTGSGGFKRSGFKTTNFTTSVLAPADGDAQAASAKQSAPGKEEEVGKKVGFAPKGESFESDTEDEGYEVYDPRFPTD